MSLACETMQAGLPSLSRGERRGNFLIRSSSTIVPTFEQSENVTNFLALVLVCHSLVPRLWGMTWHEAKFCAAGRFVSAHAHTF